MSTPPTLLVGYGTVYQHSTVRQRHDTIFSELISCRHCSKLGRLVLITWDCLHWRFFREFCFVYVL